MNDDVERQSTAQDEQQRVPFQDEQVMFDRVQVHDDITRAQVDAHGAAEESAEHTAGLLYQPGYVLDPHSSPHGVEYVPGARKSQEAADADTSPPQTGVSDE